MNEEDTGQENISTSRQDEIEEIEVAIAEHKAEIKRTRNKQRLYIYGLFPVMMYFVGTVYTGGVNFKDLGAHYSPGGTVSGGVILFSFLVVGGFFVLAALIALIVGIINCQTEITDLKSRIDIWQTKKTIATQFAKITEKPTYFDSLVEINVLNLASYYELVKTHTDKSYRLTVRICLFGFFLIVVGLVIAFVDSSNALLISRTATASGILIDLISGVFFYLYNRTIQQMKEYHNSLLSVQDTLLSFKLIEDTQDEHDKAKIVGETVAHLMNNKNVTTKNTKGASQITERRNYA